MVNPMTTSFSGPRLTAAVLAVVLIASAITEAVTRGPDAGNYTATDATVYSFVDISGGGASILADTDDGTATLTLPFPFQFYGIARTLLCVSSNGAAYFVSAIAECAGIVDFANTDLSTTSPPGDRAGLFPFWSDLTFDQPGAGAVFYQTVGAPGSRKFIIQWHKAYPSGSASPVTFQMLLSEGSGQVLFQYQAVNLGAENPASKGGAATIGSRDKDALLTGEYLQWSIGVPVIENESAILIAKPSGPRMAGAGGVRPLSFPNRPTFTINVLAPSSTGSITFLDPLPSKTINFVATSISSVVARRDWRITGTGTVNGQPGYTFIVTVSDNPDRFGIVLQRTGSTALFYNLPDTAVTSGSVAIEP
jgi:hypothetical protein